MNCPKCELPRDPKEIASGAPCPRCGEKLELDGGYGVPPIKKMIELSNPHPESWFKAFFEKGALGKYAIDKTPPIGTGLDIGSGDDKNTMSFHMGYRDLLSGKMFPHDPFARHKEHKMAFVDATIDFQERMSEVGEKHGTIGRFQLIAIQGEWAQNLTNSYMGMHPKDYCQAILDSLGLRKVIVRKTEQ